MRSAKSTRFSGGGVVAEFVRGLQKPTRFSGGGVVAEIFRRGGPGLQKAGSCRNFALMRHFYIFRLSQRGGPPLNRPLPTTQTTVKLPMSSAVFVWKTERRQRDNIGKCIAKWRRYAIEYTVVEQNDSITATASYNVGLC